MMQPMAGWPMNPNFCTNARALLVRHRRLVIAMTMAVMAAIIASVYLYQREASLRAVGRSVSVLVAAHDLAKDVQLRHAHLTRQTIPHLFVPPGALTQTADAVGQVTLTAMQAGEAVTITRIAMPSQVYALSAVLPSGHRAVTIPVNAVSGNAGLIRPGDRVDLLAQFAFGTTQRAEPMVQTLMQGAQVIAVGQTIAHRIPSGASPSHAKAHQTITLAVMPIDAQRVVFALAHGRVHVSLQPSLQEQPPRRLAPSTAASVTGMSNLLQWREYRGR
jgi:pilus assembly protein CpaB